MTDEQIMWLVDNGFTYWGDSYILYLPLHVVNINRRNNKLDYTEGKETFKLMPKETQKERDYIEKLRKEWEKLK